ncbi:MAG: ATP-dependent helicase HelY, partial [Mycobacteriales bacterium]
MAVNLVGTVGREAARALLESSFAQFQADRSVVGLSRQIQRNTEALAGYAESMHCHLGDFAEYAGLRAELTAREATLSRNGAASRRAAAVESLERLKVGDVIRVPTGRRSGLAVVLDPGVHPMSEPRPLVLTADRWAGRLSLQDFPGPVEPLTRVRVPRNFDHRSPQARRDLASTLRNAQVADADPAQRRRGRAGAADDAEVQRLRRAIRAHPCHGCADRDQHARWAERHARLRKDTDALRQRVEGKTHSIARTFDRVCALLEHRGYLVPAGTAGRAQGVGGEAAAVTPAGRQLARIWSESDLLVAECLRAGVWEHLTAPELAAAASALLYESRRDDGNQARVPAGPVQVALAATVRLWAELEADEHAHKLELTREPEVGFAWPAYRWARGESLDQVLSAATEAGIELSAGDFVRWCKQLLDLLEQLAAVAEPGSRLTGTARAAATAVRRGVVAYSGLV